MTLSRSSSRQTPLVAVLLLGIAGSLPVSAATAGDEPRDRHQAKGPLAARDLFPIRRGFLQPDLAGTATLDRGRWELVLTAGVANTLARTTAVEVALENLERREPVELDFLRGLDSDRGIHYLDSENHSLELRASRGLGNGWEVGFSVSWLTAGGGTLDGLVEDFHSTFGFDQDGRAGTLKDRHLLYLLGDRGEFVIEEAPGAGLSDLTLKAKKTLHRRGPWEYALDLSLKLPTGDEERLMSSGSTDWGFVFLAGRPLGLWHLHTGAGAFHLGEWTRLGTFDQNRLTAFTAFERINGNGTSTLFQLLAFDSPFSDLGILELEETTYQGSLGAYLPLGERHWLTLNVVENVVHFESGSDLAFHVGLKSRLP